MENNTDIYSVIRSGLLEIASPGQQPQLPTAATPTSIRIKAKFLNEKFSIEMSRPVQFNELQDHMNSRLEMKLNIYYTQRNNELLIPIRNQIELDRAIELLDCAPTQRSLRLILSKHQPDKGLPSTVYNSLAPDASGTYSATSSNIVEVPYSESRSSHASTIGSRWRGGGSSASSGVVLVDNEENGTRSASTPQAPVHWRQGSCIGSGVFGRVYICLDMDTGNEVALKKFNISARGNAHLRNQMVQLENEINLLSTIRHDRIVQYLGAQRIDDSVCIFMEYMTGGSVKDLIAIYGPLSGRVACKYTFQVLQGLEHLHRNEIIHRDIKPANILRDSRGNVKIGDFGSAKRLQALCSQQESVLVGTPYYMAPEVVLGRQYGRKADIWSLGCTLVEMLTGKPPWHDLEPMAAIFNIAQQYPSYELPQGTDPALVDLIGTIFKRDVEERPSAQQLLNNHPAFQDSVSPQL